MPTDTDASRATRTASLTLVNAMIFQQVLANRDEDIEPLETSVGRRNVAEALDRAWTSIMDDDYVPIFQLARQIVREVKGVPGIDEALRTLAKAAQRITARRAALRHDV